MKKYETYCNCNLTNLLINAGFDWQDYFVAHDINENFHWEIPLHIAQRWFREAKDIDIMVRIDYHYGEHYSKAYYCTFYIGDELYTTEHFKTYEEAQEAGIKKALEKILEKGEQKL